MKKALEIINSSAAMAHSMTFKELDPYQVDMLCETLFSQFEQFFIDGGSSRKSDLPFNLAEFQHLHILGMRKFHLMQIYAQKISYDHFCEEQRFLANMPMKLTEEEKTEHRKKMKHIFDELKTKKARNTAVTQGHRTSAVRKKAAA